MTDAATDVLAEPQVAEELDSLLRGVVLTPERDGYDEARTIYNAMIDRRPAWIARCVDVADVVAAIDAARDHDVPLAVHAGGHNGAGLSMVDDGLVVDLSPMRGVRVDADAGTVRVEGGATWADVDHATHAYGLAVPSGIISTTGVAGLTLGGGHGYLSRRFGLTVDNLLEVDVVLADGRVVTADEQRHADLFWAIRGGGGNFGIVTSFLFRAHRVDTVYGGPIVAPIDRADEVLRWYRDFVHRAPRELSGWFGFHRIPVGSPLPEELHGHDGCVTTWCWTGPMEEAEDVFAEIRAVVEPVLDLAGPMPYPALQSMFDELYYPPGLHWYWKADFVRDLDDEAIAIHRRYGSALPTERCTMHLYPIDGAVHDRGADETAFAFRDVAFSQVVVGVTDDPAQSEEVTDWARDYWRALHPHSAGGGYVNFMMEEGQDRIRASYGANHERLARVKADYDPTNLFRVNQNIRPARS